MLNFFKDVVDHCVALLRLKLLMHAPQCDTNDVAVM